MVPRERYAEASVVLRRGGVGVWGVLVGAMKTRTASDYRRLVEQGAVWVDGVRVKNPKTSLLAGNTYDVRVTGKRPEWYRIEVRKPTAAGIRAALEREDVSVTYHNEDGSPCSKEEFLDVLAEGPITVEECA